MLKMYISRLKLYQSLRSRDSKYHYITGKFNKNDDAKYQVSNKIKSNKDVDYDYALLGVKILEVF